MRFEGSACARCLLAAFAYLLLVICQTERIDGKWIPASIAEDIRESKVDCNTKGSCVYKYERVAAAVEPPSFWQRFVALFHVDVPADKRPWGRSLAFLVGVGQYDHLQPLPYVQTDLEDIRQFLLQEAGFDLVYLARDRVVSETLIRHYMIQKLPLELNEEDRLLFYYSGHGADLPGTRSGYMQFSNAQEGVFSQGVMRIKASEEEWSGLIPAKHALFIFDSCASGMGFEPKSGNAREIIASLSGGGSRHVMTAGTAVEKVYQIEMANSKGHSVFTRALLDTLREGLGAQSQDGFLLTSDLISGIKREVAPFNTRNPGRKMTPRLWPIPRPTRRDPRTGQAQRDDGDFVFLNPTVEKPVLTDRHREILGVVVKGAVPSALFSAETEYWKYVISQKDRVSTEDYRALLESYRDSFPQGLFSKLAEKELADLDALPRPAEDLTLELDHGILIEFVPIQPGEFQMGSDKGSDDEKPVRRVRISRAFQLGKYEVTQEQWQAVMGSNRSHFTGAKRPVERVSWDDAQEFIRKLNMRSDGFAYRLPTEAEWEYAARAGTIGDDAVNLEGVAWFADNSDSQTHPVGKKSPNAWGLFDMHGNVWEWVHDWYFKDYYGSRPDPDGDPPGPDSGSDRVIRGGGWFHPAVHCRSAHRDGDGPGTRSNALGFRLLRHPK